MQNFYSNFVSDLKITNPSKWYSMAQRLGAEKSHGDQELNVECLAGMDNQQAAEEVAQFFSKVSQEYSPLDLTQLPAYLPSNKPLHMSETDVATYKNTEAESHKIDTANLLTITFKSKKRISK